MKTYTFTLTQDHLTLINSALQNAPLPLRLSTALIDELNRQIKVQEQPAPPAEVEDAA